MSGRTDIIKRLRYHAEARAPSDNIGQLLRLAIQEIETLRNDRAQLVAEIVNAVRIEMEKEQK